MTLVMFHPAPPTGHPNRAIYLKYFDDVNNAMVSGERQFYKNTVTNVRKIFTVLRASADNDEGYLSVSEIARRASLHKWIVSRTVDIWMAPFLDIVIPEELDQVGLKIKLIKLLKPTITEDQVMRGLKVKM